MGDIMRVLARSFWRIVVFANVFLKSSLVATIAFMGMALPSVADELKLHDVIEKSYVTSGFGQERKNQRKHAGVDVRAPMGAFIMSPDEALVMEVTDLYRSEPRYGKVVVLKYSDGVTALFAHLDDYLVKAGDVVKKGQVFATVGDTGMSKRSHVHIETYRGKTRVDPSSVWSFLKKS